MRNHTWSEKTGGLQMMLTRKKKIRLMAVIPAFLVLAFAVACSGGEKEVVPVPETIVNDGVPPIPASIAADMKRYTDIKSTAFADWLPVNEGMVVATRRGNTTQLCALAEPDGELVQLTDFPEPVGNAEVCPDAEKRFLLFSKDSGGDEKYQYHRLDLDTRESTLITDGKSRHMGISFNHLGDRIAYVNNRRTGMLFDIYVTDPLNPDTEKMVFEARRPAYYMPVGWSPDDRRLLVLEYISANQVNSMVVNPETGESKDITPESDVPQVFGMGGFTRDGKWVYGMTDRGGEFRRLVRMELETGRILDVTSGIEWDVEGMAESRDGTQMAFTVNEDGISRLYLLDPATWEYTRVDVIPTGMVGGLTFDSAGKRLALNLNNSRMNNEAFHLDLETMRLLQWTRSDTGGLDVSSFAEPELIHYPTFDQVDGKPRMIPAFYYRPPGDAGKPFPVVIDIHGGPEGQYRPRFQGTFNYLINELRIAVIAPNVRGSSGYGKSYLLLDNAKQREDSVKDIGALLDWVETRPELDRKRVAVYGGSYGGYMVLASMIHYNDRLAAGVDIVGISNFVTFLKNTSAYRRDLRRAEYGDEREIGDFLNSISPTTNAHKITIPLFVIQGQQDPRVPASEAQQIVETVRKNDVPVWYQVATNEGHGFRKKDNRDFMTYSIVRFFQEYLLK